MWCNPCGNIPCIGCGLLWQPLRTSVFQACPAQGLPSSQGALRPMLAAGSLVTEPQNQESDHVSDKQLHLVSDMFYGVELRAQNRQHHVLGLQLFTNCFQLRPSPREGCWCDLAGWPHRPALLKLMEDPLRPRALTWSSHSHTMKEEPRILSVSWMCQSANLSPTRRRTRAHASEW